VICFEGRPCECASWCQCDLNFCWLFETVFFLPNWVYCLLLVAFTVLVGFMIFIKGDGDSDE